MVRNGQSDVESGESDEEGDMSNNVHDKTNGGTERYSDKEDCGQRQKSKKVSKKTRRISQ